MPQEPKGMPSGLNRSEGTGAPDNMKNKNLEKDRDLTRKYTDNDEEIADSVPTNNPNRNVDKTDATNAGGYKN